MMIPKEGEELQTKNVSQRDGEGSKSPVTDVPLNQKIKYHLLIRLSGLNR